MAGRKTEHARPAQPVAHDDVDFTRLGAWVGRQDPVRWILGGMVALWALTFYVLCHLRQKHFGTFAFDLGTYDQGVWLLSQLEEPFVTVRGLHLFGHHLNLSLLLIAPLYRLGGGPELLAAVQIAAQASGAVAVYLLARDRLADRWLALVLAAVLLLNPTYQFLVWEWFHPDSLAIAPVLFAYWAARANRWGWFAVAAVLAVACKEDVALVVAAMGFVIAARESRPIGLLITGLSGLWWLLATRVVMPRFLGGLSPFYDTFFGDLGQSFGEVVVNTVAKPGTTLDLITRSDRLSYYRMIFTPVAFLPVASVSTLLVAAPILAVNALTTFPYARDYKYHYSALVVAGVMLATVEGIARLGRTPSARRFLVGLVAATTLATTVAWGPSPISVQYRKGWWPLQATPRTAVQRAAVDMIPKDDPVSATYMFVPHLSHRTRIYDFPEPWKRVNWGVQGEGLHDPGVVRWLVVDRRLFGEYERRLVEHLLQGEFLARLDRDDILVLERVRAGGRPQIPE